MNSIRQKIISELEKLDIFKYINKEEGVFDRCEYENQVSEELNHQIKEHSYSTILKNQIIDIYGQGFVSIVGHKHPYEPMDIYISISNIVERSVPPKKFKKKESHLYGKNIYHSHHSQSFYSMVNCIRYFKQKYISDKQVVKRLAAIQKEHSNEENIVALFAKEVLLESLTWEKKTGEWIVYQINNGKFHFICLYIHDAHDKNDEKLFSLIETCLL